MSRIRKLPENIISRISAGEILERPAAALKELVENALDADATIIRMRFQAGGTLFLEVEDNGKGMDSEDLMICWQRHATSKLDDDNLVLLPHFGFRGEALAAIAAAADLTVQSKTQTSDALEIKIENGTLKGPKPVARPQGTLIRMDRLFSRTPARLKFLKSDSAEKRALLDVFKKMALFHPSVKFEAWEVKDDGQLAKTWISEGGQDDWISQQGRRARDVFGPQVESQMLDVSVQEGNWKIQGLIGKPEVARGNASGLVVALNGRLMQDKTLLGAVRAGFRETLPKGKHPLCVINITCPHDEVDVNAHPAKSEVRFRDSRRATGLIIKTLNTRLSQSDNRMGSGLAKQAYWGGANGHQHSEHSQTDTAPEHRPSVQRPMSWPTHRVSHHSDEQEHSFEPVAYETQTPQNNTTSHRVIGQIKNMYVLVETPNGLMMIDQHAAHERIVFEKMKSEITQGTLETQPLLIPEIISLEQEHTPNEKVVEHLANWGMVVEPFGHGSVILREVPTILTGVEARDIAELVKDTIENFEDDLENRVEDRILQRLARVSCHHSIRAGRRLKEEEMNALIVQMENTPNSGQCNHGRPTHTTLDWKTLEKLFARS